MAMQYEQKWRRNDASSFMTAVQQEDESGQLAKLDVVKMDPGLDFEFTATFDIFPTVELASFDRISVKRPSAEIKDKDLETMIERLRGQHATRAGGSTC